MKCTYSVRMYVHTIRITDWIGLKRGMFESPPSTRQPRTCLDLICASRLREDIEDDLSELTSEAVPDEVRKWLASTFAKQEQVLETIVRDSV